MLVTHTWLYVYGVFLFSESLGSTSSNFTLKANTGNDYLCVNVADCGSMFTFSGVKVPRCAVRDNSSATSRYDIAIVIFEVLFTATLWTSVNQVGQTWLQCGCEPVAPCPLAAYTTPTKLTTAQILEVTQLYQYSCPFCITFPDVMSNISMPPMILIDS